MEPQDIALFAIAAPLSSNIQLSPTDAALYLEERGGRLFPKSSMVPYPLPVDDQERSRLRGQRAMLRSLATSDHDCVNKLQESLHLATADEVIRVLDIGTGDGDWVMNMAAEFPKVYFYGTDIVPLFPRLTPPNVRFELQDVNAGPMYPPQYMDLVHAQDVSLAVRNYFDFVEDTAWILKRGGLFCVSEWTRTIDASNGDVKERAPRACAFLEFLAAKLLRDLDVEPLMRSIVPAIHSSPRFLTEHTTVKVPIGDWPSSPFERDLGLKCRLILIAFAESASLFLKQSVVPEVVDGLFHGFVHELQTVRGLTTAYYTATAIRL
ncbi:S-adenosyl-L-methionine-dependent methyltransferase [Cubamyces sp. BRFM 1775]|nr:S-adenosyl-L-methionine-dependent methyltransferase [Cubamyces sp. BRFM 1775]